MTTTLPEIQPLATMEAAWARYDELNAEGDRLWDEGRRLSDEGDRLWDEGHLVVILTARALYGKDAVIDWVERTARAASKEKP